MRTKLLGLLALAVILAVFAMPKHVDAQNRRWVDIGNMTDFGKALKREFAKIGPMCFNTWYGQYGGTTISRVYRNQTCGIPHYVWVDTTTAISGTPATLKICTTAFMIVDGEPVLDPSRLPYNVDNTLAVRASDWKVRTTRALTTPCQIVANLTVDSTYATAFASAFAAAGQTLSPQSRNDLGIGVRGQPPAAVTNFAILTPEGGWPENPDISLVSNLNEKQYDTLALGSGEKSFTSFVSDPSLIWPTLALIGVIILMVYVRSRRDEQAQLA